MAVRITTIIGSQRFELIRNKIASILATELTNQATLQTNTLFNATVFIERIVPINSSELPAVNVAYFGSTEERKNSVNSSTMQHQYAIDVYVSGATTLTTRGDQGANLNMQKLIGVIRAILYDSHYHTLDLATYVERTNIQSIDVQDPTSISDSSFVAKGRIIFNVVCEEIAAGYTPTDGENWVSIIKIDTSDEGFLIAKYEE